MDNSTGEILALKLDNARLRHKLAGAEIVVATIDLALAQAALAFSESQIDGLPDVSALAGPAEYRVALLARVAVALFRANESLQAGMEALQAAAAAAVDEERPGATLTLLGRHAAEELEPDRWYVSVEGGPPFALPEELSDIVQTNTLLAHAAAAFAQGAGLADGTRFSLFRGEGAPGELPGRYVVNGVLVEAVE